MFSKQTWLDLVTLRQDFPCLAKLLHVENEKTKTNSSKLSEEISVQTSIINSFLNDSPFWQWYKTKPRPQLIRQINLLRPGSMQNFFWGAEIGFLISERQSDPCRIGLPAGAGLIFQKCLTWSFKGQDTQTPLNLSLTRSVCIWTRSVNPPPNTWASSRETTSYHGSEGQQVHCYQVRVMFFVAFFPNQFCP